MIPNYNPSYRNSFPRLVDYNSTIMSENEKKSNEEMTCEKENVHSLISEQALAKQAIEKELNAADLEIIKNDLIAKRLAYELKSKEFDIKCKEDKENFDLLKAQYPQLFEYSGIQPVLQEKTYPISLKAHVQQDDLKVISTKKQPYLYTSGLGLSICVMARGMSETYGPCIGLSHTSSWNSARDVLTEIQEKLKKQGCEAKTIEFYLVGGQLPYRAGMDDLKEPELCDGSLEQEILYLSLAEEFNIVGAQFNLVEGENDSLSVLISADEIVWTIGEFESEFDSGDTVSTRENTEESTDGEYESDFEYSNLTANEIEEKTIADFERDIHHPYYEYPFSTENTVDAFSFDPEDTRMRKKPFNTNSEVNNK